MTTPRDVVPERDPTVALWQRYRDHGDPTARAQLLDRHLGLVHHAAREVARHGARTLELDDLVSAGTVGLVQALEGFDPGRGQAFSSYAMPRIRGAILDELRAQDWRSRGGRTRTRALDRAQAQLEQRLGRRPEAKDVADALGVDLETYWRWNAERGNGPPARLQLVDSRGDAGGPGIAEQVADPAAEAPDEAMAREQALRAMRRAFVELPSKDRLVLAFSFEEGLSLREIAQMLHVTESRVSQIRTRALRRLRETLHLEEEAA
jgi:RNA polymerase sigma factor FliA